MNSERKKREMKGQSSDLRVTDAGKSVSRRDFVRTAGLAVAALGAAPALTRAGVLRGSPLDRNRPATDSVTTIPQTTVRLGIEPFADHSIYVIGIREGYYKDVGINISPSPLGEIVQVDQVVPRFLSNSLDIIGWYGPLKLSSLPATPGYKMFAFNDIYLGTELLASPSTKAKTVDSFLKQGVSFSEAMRKTMAQLAGKTVALANDGAHRAFFNIIFELGSLRTSAVKLLSISDNEMVSLASGGKLDYASPSGAAQEVELIDQGWYSLVGTKELLAGLPPGDPRAVSTIGDTGPACGAEYFAKEYDTVLRFTSVDFRIIDQIKVAPKKSLAYEVPYLDSAAGVKTNAQALEVIFSQLDPMIDFQEAAKYWLEPKNPYYYANIYGPQIATAKAGGVLPKDSHFTPDDMFEGAKVYRDLVTLKDNYEKLVPRAAGLSGGQKTIAEAAAVQYANRNYFDAYRMLKAAVGNA